MPAFDRFLAAEQQEAFSALQALAFSEQLALAESQVLLSPACRTGVNANAAKVRHAISFFIMLFLLTKVIS